MDFLAFYGFWVFCGLPGAFYGGKIWGVGMEYRIWWEKVCNGWIDDLVFIGEGTAFEGLG